MAEQTTAELVEEQIPATDGDEESSEEVASDPYELTEENKRKISGRIDKKLKSDRSTRSQFEWGWFRNLCLDGDTRIPLLDGRHVSIRELANEVGRGQGKSVWVYGMDLDKGRITPAQMTDVWSNGFAETIELVLDAGQDRPTKSLICTKDHPVLTWFRGYVPAGELKVGESLVPFYTNVVKGYQRLYQPCTCHWETTHRSVYGDIAGAYPKGKHVHHKNEIKSDNRPENLEALSPSEHQKITVNSPTTKAAMSAGVKRSWRDPEMRARRIAAIKQNWADRKYDNAAEKRWLNPETRKNQLEGVKKHWEKRHLAKRLGIPVSELPTFPPIGLNPPQHWVNHKVKEIRPAGVREVFDATVPKTNNFALSSEIFVHNCMVAGQHDIVRFRGVVKLRKAPDWYPRTYTNKIGEKSRDLVSALLQGRVPIRYFPARDDAADRGTAEVGERIRDVIYAEAKIDMKESEIGGWFINTGNVFLIPYYDYDPKYGEAEYPRTECPLCAGQYGVNDYEENGIDAENPVCPTCTDDTGASVPLMANGEVDMLPIGALCVDVCGPFEIVGDSRIRDYRDWTWFIRKRRYDASFVKDKWDYEHAEGEQDAAGEQTQHFLDLLSQITDSFNPQMGVNAGSGGSDRTPKVTAFEYYQLPDDDFPEGVRAVRLGRESDGVVELGPLTTEYGAGIRKGKKFLSLVFLGAEVVPGRFWRKSPLDDAVPLQHFRNRVERAIDLEYRRMANSVWLNPKGSGISIFSGEAGQVHTYNPLTLGGTTIAKPERVPPQLAHLAMMIEQLKYIDDAIERVTGTYFLAGGEAPQGITAASALALLDERSKKAMSPLVREWAKGFLDFDEKALEIARANWTDKRIRVIAGRNKKYQTDSFTNADLQGAVNMEIDYENMFPKSKATERAEVAQLIEGGVINPADPQQKITILKKYGHLDLLGSFDLDIEQAQKEQENFLKWSRSNGAEGMQPTLKPLNQNSLVHFMEHCDFSKTDEYDELPPEHQQIWDAHILATCVDMGERRALFMEMQINPDAPEGMEIGTSAAQAAIQGGAQVTGGSTGLPGSTAGSRVGNNGPRQPGTKKFTGNGPNQDKAQAAANPLTQPIADIGATPMSQ